MLRRPWRKIRAFRVEGTVERVSRKQPEDCPAYGEEKYRVAMMDFGVKQNMIECLRRRGCHVTVFPALTPAETVLAGHFDGVMLSNGPGDPADNVSIIAEVKKLYDSNVPMFAVCLGHQILALATGAKTGRLDYGHRGGNHPVRDSRPAGCSSPARTTAIWSCPTAWTPTWPPSPT